MNDVTNKELAVAIENLARATQEGFLEIRKEIGDMKIDLRSEMSDMKAGLRTEMHEMKTELREEMSVMKTELRGEMKNMKEEIIDVVTRKDEQNKEDIRHLYSITDQLRKEVDTIRIKVYHGNS